MKKRTIRNRKFLNLLFTMLFSLLLLFVSCVTTDENEQVSHSDKLQKNINVVHKKLDNGINYYVMKNKHPKNRIDLKLVVKAGSTFEDDDQKGVAHLIEHMAFNGTEHFERNSLVDYFELIGMDFGAEVNAYTSFDETVYRLRVPADDPEMLKTALLVFRDWACAITFDQTELDKERGVVTEEWRLGRGLKGRTSDAEMPFLLRDSRYASRLPIGDMNVIKNISRERVIDFYKKWYRPELISVVVVGDADTSVLEKAVIETMQDIPASEDVIDIPSYTIPEQKEKDILLFKDPEQPYPLIQIMEQTEISPLKTKKVFRDILIESIAENIMNERFDAITSTPDSPWLDAAGWVSSFTNYTGFKCMGFIPKENRFKDAFSILFDEYETLCQNGILKSEFDRAKEVVFSDYCVKDVESDYFAGSIADYIISGDLYMSTEYERNTAGRLIMDIKQSEVNSYIKNFLTDRGTYLLAFLPQETKDIPDKAEIEDLWKNYKGNVSEDKNDFKSDKLLFQRPKTTSRIKTMKSNTALGTKEYTFKNGLKLILKPLKEDTNSVNISVYKKGGLSLYSDEEYPSGEIATDYAWYSGICNMSYSEFMKVFSEKQCNLKFGVGDYSTYFKTSSVYNEDLEFILQVFNQLFTNPRFTDDGWKTLYAQLSQTAESRGTRPSDVFNDKINELLYNSSLRKISVDKRYLAAINRETAERIYRESFSNAADFTIIITGDFTEKKAVELAQIYLGTLPSENETKAQQIWREPDFPQDKPYAVVKKGLDQQSKVFIGFGTKIETPETPEEIWKEKMLVSQLESYLQIKLREVIREDKSGTYGVNVDAYFTATPECFGKVQITFSCEPGREKELSNEVISQIKQLIETAPEDSYITKLKESYRRNSEMSLDSQSYVENKLINICVFKTEPEKALKDTDTLPEILTSEKLQQTAQKYLNTENYVTVILSPEK